MSNERPSDDVEPEPAQQSPEQQTEQSMDDGYYYNTGTGEVSKGRQPSWSNRMGPYRTREEAENALSLARQRTEAWDAEERER